MLGKSPHKKDYSNTLTIKSMPKQQMWVFFPPSKAFVHRVKSWIKKQWQFNVFKVQIIWFCGKKHTWNYKNICDGEEWGAAHACPFAHREAQRGGDAPGSLQAASSPALCTTDCFYFSTGRGEGLAKFPFDVSKTGIIHSCGICKAYSSYYEVVFVCLPLSQCGIL